MVDENATDKSTDISQFIKNAGYGAELTDSNELRYRKGKSGKASSLPDKIITTMVMGGVCTTIEFNKFEENLVEYLKKLKEEERRALEKQRKLNNPLNRVESNEDLYTASASLEQSENYRSMIVFSEDGKYGYLVDPVKNKFVSINLASIKACIPDDKKKGRYMDSFWDTNYYPGKYVFNPRTKQKMYQNDMNVPSYNIYKAQFWFDWTEDTVEDTSMPEIYQKFFTHLFPVDEDREFVLDFLKYSLHHKNNSYLTLVGEKGTGKGVLWSIIKNIHGRENTAVREGATAFEDKNANLEYSVFVNFDEINITKDDAYSSFKALVNDHIQIRRMRTDQYSVPNYNNIYITVNREASLYKADLSDRRFSIVDVASIPLNKVFTSDEIREIVEGKDIQELVKFLIKRDYKNNMALPYVNFKKSLDLAFMTLPDGIKTFFEWIKDTKCTDIAKSDWISTVPDLWQDKGFPFLYCLWYEHICKWLTEFNNAKLTAKPLTKTSITRAFATERLGLIRRGRQTKYHGDSTLYLRADLLELGELKALDNIPTIETFGVRKAKEPQF